MGLVAVVAAPRFDSTDLGECGMEERIGDSGFTRHWKIKSGDDVMGAHTCHVDPSIFGPRIRRSPAWCIATRL